MDMLYVILPVATTLTLVILSYTCMPAKVNVKLELGRNILVPQ